MNLSKDIRTIIENFNFERVQEAMRGMNWTWGDDPEPPRLGRLVLKAIEILQTAESHKSPTVTSGAGGFYATKNEDGLSLSFVVTQTSASDYE